MKNIFSGFKRIIGKENSPKEALESLILDRTHNTFGIIRQCPQLRISVKNFKNEPVYNDSQDELMKSIREYTEAGKNGSRLSIKMVSEIYDFLVKSRHSQESIRASLMTLLASPNGMDASFFTKGLVQSVTENSSPEEQIEFFYFLDKTSLFPPFNDIYLSQMKKLTEHHYRQLGKMSHENKIKSFYLSHKMLDFHSPNLTRPL